MEPEPTPRWSENNAGAGTYTITAKVDDGHGGSASCSTDVRVVAPPPPPAPRPPVMSCSVDRGTVMAGERVGVTATASSPQNFTLTYKWSANAGTIVGNGSAVQFDTTGLSPGTYSITGRADDGHGQAAECNTSVTVQQPPPPPQASKINECAFKPAISARVGQCLQARAGRRGAAFAERAEGNGGDHWFRRSEGQARREVEHGSRQQCVNISGGQRHRQEPDYGASGERSGRRWRGEPPNRHRVGTGRCQLLGYNSNEYNSGPGGAVASPGSCILRSRPRRSLPAERGAIRIESGFCQS